MESIQVELMNLVIVVLTALAGFVTKEVTAYLKKRGALVAYENNKEIVNTVVNATEQIYKQLNGPEKLEMAKQELATVLAEKKIKITATQIDMLIESAVKEMQKNIKDVKTSDVQ